MALNDKDFVKLENILDERDEKMLGKMEGMIESNNEKMLGKITTLMDERLLKFHEEVTEPMVNNIVEGIHDEMKAMENRLDVRMDNFENNQYRIEKKLDTVTDNHSEKIGEHEKRILHLEKRVSVSL